jgi:glycosyltransferase involved in cell wall biosynthesis
VGERRLVTVSGTIAPTTRADIDAGRRPRADYYELAAAMGADLLDYEMAGRLAGPVGRIVGKVAGESAMLAWVCWRNRGRYDTILTDGEQVGLPYAMLCKLTPRRKLPNHVMIVHIMSVRAKVAMFTLLRLRSRIDRLLVYATAQREFAINKLGVDPGAVILTPFMVDTAFFDPDSVQSADRRMICAAGLEFRDYDTLVEAVRGLDVDVVVAAASPWSKRADQVSGRAVPENVSVTKLNLFDLRQLYADSRFVVMPLHDVEFQAGITTILEAMSMAKPVVCTRTVGQTDALVDGETGRYVPPSDVVALRQAIVDLLDDPALTEKLGAAAREWAVAEADVVVYARRIADVIDALPPR